MKIKRDSYGGTRQEDVKYESVYIFFLFYRKLVAQGINKAEPGESRKMEKRNMLCTFAT